MRASLLALLLVLMLVPGLHPGGGPAVRENDPAEQTFTELMVPTPAPAMTTSTSTTDLLHWLRGTRLQELVREQRAVQRAVRTRILDLAIEVDGRTFQDQDSQMNRAVQFQVHDSFQGREADRAYWRRRFEALGY